MTIITTKWNLQDGRVQQEELHPDGKNMCSLKRPEFIPRMTTTFARSHNSKNYRIT